MVRKLDSLVNGAVNRAGILRGKAKDALAEKAEGASGIIVEVGILLVGVALLIAYRTGMASTVTSALNNAFSQITSTFSDFLQ